MGRGGGGFGVAFLRFGIHVVFVFLTRFVLEPTGLLLLAVRTGPDPLRVKASHAAPPPPHPSP